ncbi:MAG: hypothetical protein K0S32_3692 [Bacteroidetes bacterium]|jgi:hypothetical protein|nr:hypothetical protein [Bacteroidota bacterium]
MKIIKSLLVACLITVTGTTVSVAKTSIVYNETPAKTICIKNPAAADVNKFFSTSTVMFFEVYKPGSKEDFMKILKSFKDDKNVESVSEGNVAGDYHGMTIVLKSAKDKAWFINQFKKAGLGHIKINNNPIVEIEKM